MRVGIGLPAAVPEADMTMVGRWSAETERAGNAVLLAKQVSSVGRLSAGRLTVGLGGAAVRPAPDEGGRGGRGTGLG